MRLFTSPSADDPGEPDIRSATRFLFWIMRRQWRSLAVAGVFGSAWMGCIAALPGAIGQGIDEGVAARDTGQTLLWSTVIVVLALVMAGMGTIRHRLAVHNYLVGAYRIVRLTTRQAIRVGGALPRQIATGEVVSVGSADPVQIGTALDVLGRTIGSLMTFTAVAVVLLDMSTWLGLLILVGLPVQALIIAPLLRPLQQREHAYRVRQGELTSRANDIVAGLRVLRGIGGEDLYSRRYRESSERVRRFGVRVATAGAVMRGLQMLLPGLLLAGVTWFGARLTVAGQITPGELIAVFGYTSFLLMPMNVFLETARKYTAAHAAARRIVALLSVGPDVRDRPDAVPLTEPIASLSDPESGLELREGDHAAVVCEDPHDAMAIADRLARHVDSDASVNGRRLDGFVLDDVRRRILLADNDAHFFAGRLRDQVDVACARDDATVAAALDTAVAWDVVDAVGGLDGRLEPDGRNVSGGQRQRLRLARCLLTDPDVLLLLEPTSAVDAHTEALIARRLKDARRHRTTLIATTSPLLLEHAATVFFVSDGKVLATGTHTELLASDPRYHAVVSRQTNEEERTDVT